MFICYNCMSTFAKSSMDLSDSEYQPHGVKRKNKVILKPEEVNNGDIIYVKTDFIINGEFVNNILPKIKNKFKLITGTSSYSIDLNSNYLKILESDKLIHWFACNPPIEKNDKISFIPIGFQEYERIENVFDFIVSEMNSDVSWDTKKDRIYIPYHSNTHPSRNSLIKKLESLPYVDVENQKLDFISYINKMKEYKYVLSLRGRGWDCHRHYEVLLSGSIPIMEKGPISEHFSFHKIPFEYIENIENVLFDKKYTINKNVLSLDYWKNFILSGNQ